MGYTHYWKQEVTANDYKEQSQKALSEIKKIVELLPEVPNTAGGYYEGSESILRDGYGEGEPEIDEFGVCFNGDAENDLDHETFQYDFIGGHIKFAFCKTARKPYDKAVCLCLLALANNIEGFSFTSDGNVNDWQPAIDFYQSVITSHVSENLQKSLDKLKA